MKRRFRSSQEEFTWSTGRINLIIICAYANAVQTSLKLRCKIIYTISLFTAELVHALSGLNAIGRLFSSRGSSVEGGKPVLIETKNYLQLRELSSYSVLPGAIPTIDSLDHDDPHGGDDGYAEHVHDLPIRPMLFHMIIQSFLSHPKLVS